MRKIILLLILIGAGVAAWYVGRHRYPSSRVNVNGRAYDIIIYDRACDGPRMCVAQIVFLSGTTDSMALIAEGKGLLPWVETHAMEPADRGVTLVALQPGFLHLLAPRAAHGFMYGFLGKDDWQYLGRRDIGPGLRAVLE